MTEKKTIDPAISEYFSNLAKKRKNPKGGFSDPELAKKAGEAGRLTQKRQREQQDSTQEQEQSQS